MSAHNLLKMKFFIIHGISGHSQENWFPWLKKKLEELGHLVIIPNFPNPDNPKLGEWLDYFNQYQEQLDENSILVGHSLGAPFLLSILEKQKVKAAFFVAGFCSLPENEFKDKMSDFIKNYDWEKIRQNCDYSFVFHSDNDPYVSIEKGKELVRNLNGDLTVVSGAGHFNSSAGYNKFELLLEKIKEIL